MIFDDDQIERYIRAEMSEDDAVGFKKAILKNPQLKNKVRLLCLLIKAIKKRYKILYLVDGIK